MLHVRVNVPPVPAALEAMAEGLVRLNEWYMNAFADNDVYYPPLYESGVVYRREPANQEWWESAADVRSLATSRSGDCEDVAAYRAAELRVFDGDDGARLIVVPTKRGSFHAIVQHGDGTREDPSRILVELERARIDRAQNRVKRGRKAA